MIALQGVCLPSQKHLLTRQTKTSCKPSISFSSSSLPPHVQPTTIKISLKPAPIVAAASPTTGHKTNGNLHTDPKPRMRNGPEPLAQSIKAGMSSHASPPRGSAARSQKAKTTRGFRSTARDGSALFTPQMQDAQARNKDPYASDDSSEGGAYEGGSGKRFDAYGNDSYEQIQRRREAAIVLDSPELLMMHAQARNDTIPGTRYYFSKMLCGYLDENDTYEVVKGPPVQKEPERGKEKSNLGKGKGKETSGS